MARTKQRYVENSKEKEAKPLSSVYRAGIYVRLSQERTEEYRNKVAPFPTKKKLAYNGQKKKGLPLKRHTAIMNIQVQISRDRHLKK